MASKKLINISNLQKFLSKLNEKFALKKTMKGISEDSEGNIIIGEEGLVPTPNENSKGKFLRSDGEWALPSETAVYDSMTLEEGVAGVSEVDRVLNAKNLKQIVNSDGFLTSLDSSKLTGIINIENLPQGALERILIVSSKEERLTLLDTEVQLGDVVKEADTGLMYYVINTEKLNSEEGYTQFTAGSASSVPWSGVTDKPSIPTKTSDLTNDSDFAIDGDVVHKSGNEEISGSKTFINGTWVTNNQTTMGYSIKNIAIARNDVPSEYYHHTFRAYDKNSKIMGEYCIEKSTNGDALLNMGVRSEDASGTQISYGMQFRMTNDGSLVRFMPSENNKVHLGDPSAKWLKVHSDDVVHTSGNETISGTKTFSGATISNKQLQYKDTIYDWTDTALNTWCDAGHVSWYDKTNTRRMHELIGAKGGVWRKACYINENQYFSVDSNRNISYWGSTTFNGNVLFTQDMYFKNNNIDLTETPSSTLYSNFIFKDKNNQNVSYIQYAKRNTEPDILGLYINDKDKNLHGIQITSNNYVLPYGNNIYSLGSSNNKWSNVYATAFNGNLKGNADSSTKASYLDNYSVPGMNKIYLDWDKQVESYVGLKVDNTVMGGLITTKNIGSQSVSSATYATTQATTDNSTKIATTAWVRTYVDSVAGSSAVGSSISAYYSNATTLTAEGSSSSSGGSYPSDYSDYINISPTVGTIYTGSQLFGTLNASASGSKYSYSPSGSTVYQTTAKATATFSGAFSSSAKYLCTTANAVKFRAFVSQGTTSDIGTASVSDNSSAKSIFIRVQ